MPKDVTCMVCDDGLRAEGTALVKPCVTCGQSWCLTCVLARSTLAAKSLGDMPPKCCKPFDPRLVLKVLPEDAHQDYKSLFDESRTEVKERVYCPNRTCGSFISPYEIAKQQQACKPLDASIKVPDGDDKHKRHDSAVPTPNPHKVNCPKCSTTVCLTCKQASHDGTPCVMEDDPVVAQIHKFGYKRCPRCGHGTRRMWGCNHMQCVCGAHWCWSCERNFYVCDTFGGCEDDEGDESDPSDDEYDGEEPEVVEAAASSTSTPTPGTSTEETVTNGEASTTDNTQTTNLVLRRRRSVNLDRGSHGYWEGRGDFGDEPSNDEQENWGCPHDFDNNTVHKADELGKQVCWDCWKTIDGDCQSCWLCNLVRCEECLKFLSMKRR